MVDQTIEIKLVLRDELSRQLAPVTQALRELQATRINAPVIGMQRLGAASQVLHREFSSLARLTFGGLIGGGVVAGIYNTVKAIGDLARENLALRYSAEGLGVHPEFLEQMQDGLQALGMSAEQASSSVSSAINTLREAEVKGTKSGLFGALEKGAHGSGLRLWREIREQMAGPEGAEGAFKFLITRMRDMNPSGQRGLMKHLGLSSLAFKDLQEVLPQLNKRIQLSREESVKLQVANTNFGINMGNVGRILGSAVMPGLAKITKAFSDYLQTEAGKKFAAELKEWSTSVGDAIDKWVREGGLQKEIDGIKQAVQDVKDAMAGADVVIQRIGTEWEDLINGLTETGFVDWLKDVATWLGIIGPDLDEGKVTLLERAAAALKDIMASKRTRQDELEAGDWQLFREDWERSLMPPGTAPTPRFVPQGVPRATPQSGEGQPKSEQERRADLAHEKNERDALTRELRDATYAMAKFNDYTAPGGPEGSADGRSGYGAGLPLAPSFDISSVLGPAGGGKKNRPWPTLPSSATSLSAIPGSVRPAQSSGYGFASWYGNRPDLGFRDDEDKGRKGVSEREQGIALGPRETLGQHHYLTDPHTGLTHVTKQTDTGPNIRTQKLVDIHASQLERMGYSAQTFPSGRGIWGVAPTNFEKPELWAGRSGSFDEEGMSGITRAQAREASGGGTINGSATVDIDVSGLGGGESRSDSLFKPSPLGGAVQMQNAQHVPNNQLSFQ